MDKMEIIQEYREKIKECQAIINENKKLNLQLHKELKDIEDLKQQLQYLIELNS